VYSLWPLVFWPCMPGGFLLASIFCVFGGMLKTIQWSYIFSERTSAGTSGSSRIKTRDFAWGGMSENSSGGFVFFPSQV